jgi:uncharacterized protein (DUF342 family)
VIDFPALQQAVKIKLEEDRAIQTIDAEGSNLEAAVLEASTILGIPIYNLEYEVLLQKSSFLGIGENICKIRAFERPNMKKKRIELETQIIEDSEFGDIELLDDKDGDVFVQRRHDGVYIKATQPVGHGRKAAMSDAELALKNYKIIDYDETLVKEAVKAAKGVYVRICDYKNVSANDTSIQVEVTDSEMHGYITINPPGPGGCDLTYEEYISMLKQNSICSCIDEKYLQSIADKPLYKQRLCIATGKKPINGKDAYMEYFFETGKAKIHLVTNTTGQVNFKDLNTIQNVCKGEKLARKIDPEPGVDGNTVTGKIVPASSWGKDIAIGLGKNVRIADDGYTVIAEINGQVMLQNGKVSVEMVYVIDGSVNLKTGNIIFLGNVIVKGNVEEGFSVKAAGNIEVHGAVDRAELNAEGDIIVNQGITGKEDIKIHTGGNIWAKFIENANIEAGDSVLATGGIINCTIFASKKILCHGKRAVIMGGKLCAGEEINAKQIGNPSGNSETICEVGYDPQTKFRLDNLTSKKSMIKMEIEEIELNLLTLSNVKKQRGALPDDKEEYFLELSEKRVSLSRELLALDKEITDLTEVLESLQSQGKVSASGNIYPGVILCIQNQRATVRTDQKNISFILEDDIIRTIPYTAINMDALKAKAET